MEMECGNNALVLQKLRFIAEGTYIFTYYYDRTFDETRQFKSAGRKSRRTYFNQEKENIGSSTEPSVNVKR